jgi:hypothetical protein
MVVDYLRYFVELSAALLAAIALPYFVVTLYRSRRIPECYSCGAMKMRPSRVVGFWDVLGSAFLIAPYRCSGCRERFHAFTLLSNSKKPAGAPAFQPQRVVKVAFRFRHGLLNRVSIHVTQRPPESTDSSVLQTQIS